MVFTCKQTDIPTSQRRIPTSMLTLNNYTIDSSHMLFGLIAGVIDFSFLHVLNIKYFVVLL